MNVSDAKLKLSTLLSFARSSLIMFLEDDDQKLNFVENEKITFDP